MRETLAWLYENRVFQFLAIENNSENIGSVTHVFRNDLFHASLARLSKDGYGTVDDLHKEWRSTGNHPLHFIIGKILNQ